MTATPSMTTKTNVTGLMLAGIAAATLVALLQLVQLPGIGGWRTSAAAPAPMTVPVQTRGTHATDAGLTLDQAEVSTARGRN
jgi:hypothetical protein